MWVWHSIAIMLCGAINIYVKVGRLSNIGCMHDYEYNLAVICEWKTKKKLSIALIPPSLLSVKYGKFT